MRRGSIVAAFMAALSLPVVPGLKPRRGACGDMCLSTLREAPSAPFRARTGALVAPLTIGRLHYDGGGDWYANPSSLPNLLQAIRDRTTLAVGDRERVVTLTSPDLWDVPYLYMTGHGNVRFTDDETRVLRSYLENGGFFHADDNYGLDESFRREIARVFPDRPLVEVPLDHPIYRVVYDFPRGIPKIHEHDGLPAQGFGIFLGRRLAVYYSYQSDLGDGWEDADVHGDPPAIREEALRMGVNLFAYAVSGAK